MSIDTIRADGCGLRSVTPHSISSAHRSLPYANSPLTFSTPSGRDASVPTPPVVVRSRTPVEVVVIGSLRSLQQDPGRRGGVAGEHVLVDRDEPVVLDHWSAVDEQQPQRWR